MPTTHTDRTRPSATTLTGRTQPSTTFTTDRGDEGYLLWSDTEFLLWSDTDDDKILISGLATARDTRTRP